MNALAESSWLDGLWLVLVLAATLGSLILLAGLLAGGSYANKNPRRVKWFWRWSYVQTFALVGWASVGRCFDQMPNCFEAFLRDGGATAFTRTLALAWLSIAGLLLAFDSFRLWMSYRWSRTWERVQMPLVSDVMQTLKLKRDLDVRLTEDVTSPFVFGFFRPVLVLPVGLGETLSPSQLRAVIAHELAHLQDHDTLFAGAELLFRRLLFFHPLVYAAARAYQSTQEKAADQRVLESLGIRPSEYARAFMDLIEWAWNGRQPISSVAAVSTYNKLRDRLQFIEAYQPGQENSWLRWLLPLTLLVSSGWSMAQTRSSLQARPGMCIQVQHEKFIEKLLQVESATNKCERP